MVKAIIPVVVILNLQVVIMLSKAGFKDVWTLVIGAISLVALVFFDIHPLFMIVAALLFGGLFLK